MKKLITLIPLFLCSCSIYNRDFDCPPGKGIGCKSVTEIEEMIVETEEGPDLFPSEAVGPDCKECKNSKALEESVKRVWVKGSYLYFTV